MTICSNLFESDKFLSFFEKIQNLERIRNKDQIYNVEMFV